MLVDYHCHTAFSADCNVAMVDQCHAAVARGIRQIAFTEHEDYNPEDPTSFFFRHDEYWSEVMRCRGRFDGTLIVRAGIEISEPHRHRRRVADVLRRYDWDFVLGSLHWLTPTIDSCKEAFFTYAGDWRRSFADYFAEMRALARDGDFDVLAHLDYPTRYNRHRFADAFDIGEFEGLIREVLKALIAAHKGIEINTSPWRKGLSAPNPAPAVLRWYCELGGRLLTLGSDAHATQDVGADIARAARLADAIGFTAIAVYERRQPKLVPIRSLLEA